MISLLNLLLIFLSLIVVVWVVYWTDLILWWSDPIIVPPEVFLRYQKETPKIKDESEKTCVVGSGFSGLAVCGSLKRHGIPFDCFEKNDKIGGNWYSGVYNSTHIISSKLTTEYKDYPMPKEYPDFPSSIQMIKYLNDYCDHFKFRENISLNTEILNCEKLKDDKWEVEFKSNGKIEKKIYKSLIICNGHHWNKRIPKIEGNFTGDILHSKDYKSPEILHGKRVLVVGGGNSACDICVESAKHSFSTDISLRRGYWFLPRLMFGIPMVEMVKPFMPLFFQRILIKLIMKVVVGNFESYGLEKPDHDVFEHHPTINSELLHLIKLGKIKPIKEIERFDKNGSKEITFKDGTKKEFDVIIFCTGYNSAIPMMKNYIDYKDGIPQLVSGAFLKGIKNFYYVGLGQPRYGAGPLLTAGSDLIAKVILLQDYLTDDFGTILTKKFGIKPYRRGNKSADVLIDPHTMYKQLMTMRYLLIFYIKYWTNIKL